MECKDLTLLRKATITYEVEFKKDGGTVDITDWTVYFTIKSDMKDTDASAKLKKKVISFSEPLSGKALIELTTADTDITAGNYYYAVDYLDDDSNQGTLVWGRIKLIEPVLQERD